MKKLLIWILVILIVLFLLLYVYTTFNNKNISEFDPFSANLVQNIYSKDSYSKELLQMTYQ